MRLSCRHIVKCIITTKILNKLAYENYFGLEIAGKRLPLGKLNNAFVGELFIGDYDT
jgi:hypothetical protein